MQVKVSSTMVGSPQEGVMGAWSPESSSASSLYYSSAPAAAVPAAALGPGISGRLPVPAAGPGSLAHLEVGPELGRGLGYFILLTPFPPLSPKSLEGNSPLQNSQPSNSPFPALSKFGDPLPNHLSSLSCSSFPLLVSPLC